MADRPTPSREDPPEATLWAEPAGAYPIPVHPDSMFWSPPASQPHAPAWTVGELMAAVLTCGLTVPLIRTSHRKRTTTTR